MTAAHAQAFSRAAEWTDGSAVILPVPASVLSLPYTLDCGQAFRWRARADGWWIGVVHGHAVRFRRDGDAVTAHVYPGRDDAAGFVSRYLRLDVDLESLYVKFAEAGEETATAIQRFAGLRLLLQEPRETLLSFICSTANSVPRISKAVETMSALYGSQIARLDGTDYYAFPSAESLATAPVDELREQCRLGWRGDNVRRVASELAEMPAGWPEPLRALSYAGAKAELMRVRGIGPKIADCVCLFALGKDEAVPVDTHIWAVAKELFGAQIPTRTLTAATYDTLAGLFVERFGAYAGWAQQYLYMQRRAIQGHVHV